jgi:uncharacterized protein YbjT (DUF2867 family)
VSVASRSLVLLGASGLVGGRLFRRAVLDSGYSRLTVLTRRPLALEGEKVREVVVDFDHPETFREHLVADDLFCCLGTTIKKAGSEAAFRRVDFEVPVAVAREAREAGASQFLIVTAVGADARSRVFYSRVKGEVEAALRALNFPRGLKVFRPSIIVGERSERRPAERAAMALMRATRPLFLGGLARYRAIDADDIAAAMLAAARLESSDGMQVYEGERLFALAAPAVA